MLTGATKSRLEKLRLRAWAADSNFQIYALSQVRSTTQQRLPLRCCQGQPFARRTTATFAYRKSASKRKSQAIWIEMQDRRFERIHSTRHQIENTLDSPKKAAVFTPKPQQSSWGLNETTVFLCVFVASGKHQWAPHMAALRPMGQTKHGNFRHAQKIRRKCWRNLKPHGETSATGQCGNVEASAMLRRTIPIGFHCF